MTTNDVGDATPPPPKGFLYHLGHSVGPFLLIVMAGQARLLNIVGWVVGWAFQIAIVVGFPLWALWALVRLVKWAWLN